MGKEGGGLGIKVERRSVIAIGGYGDPKVSGVRGLFLASFFFLSRSIV